MFNTDIPTLVSRAIVFLVAVVVHEFAHAWVAYTQGDTTARDMNRMTLDPRANVWWPGYFMGVLFGFAIMGTAPVNPYRMRNPRLGMFLAVLAGPVANLLLAIAFAIPMRLLDISPSGGSINQLLPAPERLLTDMVFLNLLLFVFNLIPLSPLDGWTVVKEILPPQMSVTWQRYQQESMYVLFGLILWSFFGISFLAAISPSLANTLDPIRWLVSEPTIALFWLLL